MSRTEGPRSLAGAAIAIMCAGLPCESAAGTTTLKASSSAAAVNVNVSISGADLTLRDALLAVGSAPPKYAKTTNLAAYAKSVSSSNGITLDISATKIYDAAACAGQSGSAITSTSSSYATTLSAVVGSPIGPLMTITGTGVSSKAAFKLNTTGAGVAFASAKITKLAINAPSLGINNVTFAGTPTRNKVLYHNSDFSIAAYLNFQTNGLSTDDKLSSVKVDAINVKFKNFSAYGFTVNGDIEIGSSLAN